jgi:chromosome segregation ATPase
MNKPLSDGNENCIDIFVLSTCTSESPVQVAPLENLGYHVTCFSDSNQLLESLRDGKPNLLICDSVTLGDIAYDLCRNLKEDHDLWVVPVLIVAGATNLSDLLHVLDCNADNFISSPYDPAYLAAMIEGLLSTPVERQTPDQIKTQFKIQHDDQLFVVTADRRKLLEFLLSSFEIAVGRSGEIIRITNKNEALLRSLASSDTRVRDQDQALEKNARTLVQKEHSISTLSADLVERDHRIQEHTEEIHRLETELSARDTQLASLSEDVRNRSGELGTLSERYTIETADLKQQVTSLTGCLASTHSDLDAARESLAGETRHRGEIEARLLESETLQRKTEQSLQELTLECEQLRSTLSAEKVRAESAEHEAKTLVQAKNESEQDLIRIIDEFKNTVKKQDEDLLHLTEDLTARNTRITELEHRATDLEADRSRVCEEMQAGAESSAATISGLRTRVDEMEAVLAIKEQEIASRDATLRQLEEARDQAAQDMHALTEDLSAARIHLTEAESVHQSAIAELNKDLEARDISLNELRTAIRSVQEESESYRTSLAKIRNDLETATSTRTDLESGLENANVMIRKLDSDLQQVSATKAEAHQEIQRLTDELTGAMGELEQSRQRHTETEESLRAEQNNKEQVSREVLEISRQRDAIEQELAEEKRIRAELTSERERLLQQITESKRDDEARDAASSEKIAALAADLEATRSTCSTLESQISTITHEKERAEKQITNLSAEIDQARTALADEWEDHMNAQERLASTTLEKQQMASSFQRPGELESERAKKRALIVKGPDLPMTTGKPMHSLSVFSTAPKVEFPVPRITNVEDLFEDDEPADDDTSDVPAVSIIHEPAEIEFDVETDVPLADPGVSNYESGNEPAESADEADEEEDPDDGPALTTQQDDAADIPVPFSFNRAQWYDLLKWSHHAGTLSSEQRMQIVRMGRLIQQGRKLTPKQDEQVMEMILLAQAQGFRFGR